MNEYQHINKAASPLVPAIQGEEPSLTAQQADGTNLSLSKVAPQTISVQRG